MTLNRPEDPTTMNVHLLTPVPSDVGFNHTKTSQFFITIYRQLESSTTASKNKLGGNFLKYILDIQLRIQSSHPNQIYPYLVSLLFGACRHTGLQSSNATIGHIPAWPFKQTKASCKAPICPSTPHPLGISRPSQRIVEVIRDKMST